MKDLHVHFSRSFASVSVTDDQGVARSSSGSKMGAVLAAMHDDDRLMLVRFCQAITEACQGNQQRLVEW